MTFCGHKALSGYDFFFMNPTKIESKTQIPDKKIVIKGYHCFDEEKNKLNLLFHRKSAHCIHCLILKQKHSRKMCVKIIK